MNAKNKETVKIIEAMDLAGYVVESVEPEFQGTLSDSSMSFGPTGRVLIAIHPAEKD